MSSFLCFICHSTVNAETNEETREKYREVVGINLCPDSQLCFICCHVLNKLTLFRAICLKRSLEYPVLFSEKGTINLQKSDLEIHVLCSYECNQYQNQQNNKLYKFNETDDSNGDRSNDKDNQYVKFEGDEFHNYFNQCKYQNVNEQYAYNDNITNNKILNRDEDVDDHLTEMNQHNQYNKQIDELNDRTFINDTTDISESEYVINLDDNRGIIETGSKSNCNSCSNFNNTDDNIVNYNADEDNYTNINENQVITKEQISVATNVEVPNNVDHHDSQNEQIPETKAKKIKKKGYKKIILSLEEQKAGLEANRKDKKYIEAEYKCYNCALSFLFKDTYQAHMMRHEESNGEYQCVTCTLRFATVALLRTHKACHAERYQCRKCGCLLKQRAKRLHSCYKIKETQSVSCHLCGNLFRDANGLQQHLKRVHASKTSGRLYACTVCGERYTNQSGLRTHMIKHVNRRFNCDKCPATYKSPYTLKQHKKCHENGGDLGSGGSLHHCAVCGATYATRKSLLAHTRNTTNHQTTLFECPICSRTCPNQKSLASHIQSVHSTTKDFCCTVCPARYTNRKSLVRHMGTHNRKAEVKLAICHLCGSGYKSTSKLNRHLREVCEKAKLEEQLSALYD